MAMKAKIAILGCGPGAHECVTLETLAAIESAEVLIGSARLLSLFPEAGAKRIVVRGFRDETITAICKHLDQQIAVLVTGDPGLASLASAVIDHFGVSSCRVVPGISSVQTAFARLGISWEGTKIVSAHAGVPALDFQALMAEEKIAVLTGDAQSITWITALANVLGADWTITVAQDLTLPSERIYQIDAAGMSQLRAPLRAVILLLRRSRA